MKKISFCRNCPGLCSVELEVEDNHITKLAGNRTSPISKGYFCVKANASMERHNGTRRLSSSFRAEGGTHRPIKTEAAITEIAKKLNAIIAEHGPRAVAVYYGTGAFYSATAISITKSWAKAIKTPHIYSSQTIDQSPKTIRALRMGNFKSGKQPFMTSDVWLFSGINPVVSHLGGFGANTMYAPGIAMREAKARGMKMIVIDPRQTETASFADIHLQPKPGQDVAIHAAMINIILSEGWHDQDFCDRYVTNLGRLRDAVARYTPEYAASEAGIDAEDIREATRMFATAKTGCAMSGTGTNMTPHANLAEHLLECLNAICGRYRRAGDEVLNQSALYEHTVQEGVDGPFHIWDVSPRMASHPDVGYAVPDEFPVNLLADEILHEGEGKIRALISVAGNPVQGIPDQLAVTKAFRDLELLVSLDIIMNETCGLSHYVINSKLPYERADVSLLTDGNSPFPAAQYTDAILDAPEGAIEEWEFFYELSREMGLDLSWGLQVFFLTTERAMKLDRKPTAEEMLEFVCQHPDLPLSKLKSASGGVVADFPPKFVQPADPGNQARLDLLPDEVLSELDESYATHQRQHLREGEMLLHVRRRLEVVNSVYQDSRAAQRRIPHNPLYMHPDDMDFRGLASGDQVRVTTPHGSLVARARADGSQRRGSVSMHHCWATDASSPATVNILIDRNGLREARNMTPRMSAIPVKIGRVAADAG